MMQTIRQVLVMKTSKIHADALAHPNVLAASMVDIISLLQELKSEPVSHPHIIFNEKEKT